MDTTTSVSHSASDKASVSGRLRFRPDIQGLRGLAVIVVMIFHIWPDYLSGGYVGVDVFFVISGYLITRLLITEIQSVGSFSVLEFYLRRIRRLVPCASFVLVVVSIASFFILPATQWRNTAHGILASALYVENWDLIHKSANYLNASFTPTPVQHYWSLSVEGQFYLIWPIVILVGDRFIFKRSYNTRAPLIAFSAMTIFLFVCSLVICYQASVPAYFSTITRIWELTLGGAIIFAGRELILVKRRSLAFLEWLGLLMILFASLYFSTSTLFPGYAALLPTAGAALIICAGGTDNRISVSRILAAQPLSHIGDISYSMYLWHWPIVACFRELWTTDIGLLNGVIIFCLTTVLSHLTWKYVEKPFHRPVGHGRLITQNTSKLATACTGVSIAFGLALLGYLELLQRETCCVALDAAAYPGAQALGQSLRPANAALPFFPSALNAKYDRSVSVKDGCEVPYSRVQLKPCRYGVANGNLRVVLAGDSHAEQWLPALNVIAQTRQLDITLYIKSHCAFADVTQYLFEEGRVYSECDEWNQRLLERLQRSPPHIFITSAINGYKVVGSRDAEDSTIKLIDGFRTVWKNLSNAGAKVFVIKDVPYMPFDVPDCLARRGSTIEKCSAPRQVALSSIDPIAKATSSDNIATLLDLNDYICTSDKCQAVVGNVLVYQDSNHLTATYTRSLAPMLDEKINWQNTSSRVEVE